MEKNILTSLNKNNISIKQKNDQILSKEEKESNINDNNKINNFLDSDLLSTIQNFLDTNKENKDKEKEKEKIINDSNKMFFSSKKLKIRAELTNKN